MLGSLALGTSRTASEALIKALKHGIRCGVRVIDTAILYNNDEAVRTAIHESIAGEDDKYHQSFNLTNVTDPKII